MGNSEFYEMVSCTCDVFVCIGDCQNGFYNELLIKNYYCFKLLSGPNVINIEVDARFNLFFTFFRSLLRKDCLNT